MFFKIHQNDPTLHAIVDVGAILVYTLSRQRRAANNGKQACKQLPGLTCGDTNRLSSDAGRFTKEGQEGTGSDASCTYGNAGCCTCRVGAGSAGSPSSSLDFSGQLGKELFQSKFQLAVDADAKCSSILESNRFGAFAMDAGMAATTATAAATDGKWYDLLSVNETPDERFAIDLGEGQIGTGNAVNLFPERGC